MTIDVNTAVSAAMTSPEMMKALEAIEAVCNENDAGFIEFTVRMTGKLNGRMIPFSVTFCVGEEEPAE